MTEHYRQHHVPESNAVAQHHERPPAAPTDLRLAIVATAHCLFGCGLGEIVGMIVGMQLGFSDTATIILAVTLGFIFGLGFGIRPLLRAQLPFARALKTVVAAESLGIAVMEAVDIAVIVNIPGALDAHLTDPLFWGGMAVALAAGYLAALPVNYMLIRKGLRHVH